MGYQWDFQVVLDSLPLLLHGLQFSVVLAIITMFLGSVLGFLVALARLKGQHPLAWAGAAYTEFFRTTPFLAQALWIYYALPIITGVRIPSFGSAVIALSLNVGAFMSEIFRAGILSIGRGQSEAGLSLGLTPAQTMRRIVFPQAFRNVVPPTTSIWLSLFKDTSVVSLITVPEMMYQARTLAVSTYRPVEVLTVTALIYFIVVYPQSIVIDWAHEAWRGRRKLHEKGTLVAVEDVAEVVGGVDEG